MRNGTPSNKPPETIGTPDTTSRPVLRQARRGEGRNEARQHESRTRGKTATRPRRAKQADRTDRMTRHRHAIAKTRTNGQGATNRPNPTDETGAESKHAVGNARDGKHGAKRGRDPMTTTETRPGKQEKTRHERKTQTAGETIANERKRESDTTR